MAEVGGAYPKKCEWKTKTLKNIIKQTINLVPTSGNVTVDPNSRIYVDLPVDSSIDLSTLVMYFNGWTDTGAQSIGGATGYCSARFLPRNTQSIIQNLEILVNGRSVQNIPEYNYIYNILHDFSVSSANVPIKMMGENEDPSMDYWNNGGVITPRRGYPIGLVNATSTSPTANNYDLYCIRNWLGVLDGSTKILNTGKVGLITLVITLAPAAITMLGATNAAALTAVPVAGVAATTVKVVPDRKSVV